MATKRKAQKTGNVTVSAQPQVQAQLHPVRIKELFTERRMYENYPSYQRRKVWPLKFKQELVNVILSGRTFPALIAYKEIDENGKQTYYIKDGQQRLSAILDFVDNKFKTWTVGQKEDAEPNSPPPVEPGKFFKDLSPMAKNIFFDYVVHIAVEPKTSDEEEREHFRGSQNHVPLSPAEKIDTYVSKAKEAAERIEKHPFWDDFYMGKEVYRKKIFLSSLYLLALEMSTDGMVDLQSTHFIHALASGKRDNTVTEEVIETVWSRLDAASCVFSGTQFTIRATAIVMYQAVMFVERAGAVIRSETDKGKLTPWITEVIAESNNTPNVIGYQRPLQQSGRKPIQRAFWERHRGTILALFGLRDAVIPV